MTKISGRTLIFTSFVIRPPFLLIYLRCSHLCIYVICFADQIRLNIFYAVHCFQVISLLEIKLSIG